MAMTRGRIRRKDSGRVVVIASLLGLVTAVALVWLIVQVASANPEKVKLGDDVFALANAKRLAGQIRDQDAPLLLKDPRSVQPGREIFVHHLGDDPKTGWLALEAYTPGGPREVRCILTWDGAADIFRDPCSSATYPATGTGLVGYPARVNADGVVEIDFRAPADSPTVTPG